MRAGPVLIAILALAPPSAIAVSTCAANVCASTYSASAGSCNGEGSERNDAFVGVRDITIQGLHTGSASVSASTFCLKAGQGTYREVRLDVGSQDVAGATDTYVALYNDNGSCTMLVAHEDPPAGSLQRGSSCLAQLPPNAPGVLP